MDTYKNMITDPSNQQVSSREYRGNQLLLIVYMVFRLGFAFTTLALSGIPKWLGLSMHFFSFFIIILLIFNSRNNLSFYNIDQSAIVILFLFSIVFRIRKFDSLFAFFFEVVFLFATTVVLVIFLNKSITLNKNKIISKWFLLSIISGVLFSILMISIENGTDFDTILNSNSFQSVYSIFYYIFYGIGVTGIFEEPIYRGFLWGTLKKSGMSDWISLIIQASLFWISHLNMIHSTFSFFIIAPIFSLILGLLMYKSKSIIPPLLFHCIYNAYLNVMK